jgi:hypothetical protein
VIIESDRVDPAAGEPSDDLGLGIEIVGLVTKMVAGVGPEPRPQALDAVENRARILGPAQAAFPRPGHAMNDGRDAVGDGLPIAFEQRNVDRKSYSRPRHHLSLEGIAVDVDDPGKDQKAAGVDPPFGVRLRADAGDDPGLAIEIDAGLLERASDERATAFDAHAHD